MQTITDFLFQIFFLEFNWALTGSALLAKASVYSRADMAQSTGRKVSLLFLFDDSILGVFKHLLLLLLLDLILNSRQIFIVQLIRGFYRDSGATLSLLNRCYLKILVEDAWRNVLS